MAGDLRVSWDTRNDAVLIEAPQSVAAWFVCLRKDTTAGPWVTVAAQQFVGHGQYFWCLDKTAPRGSTVTYLVIARLIAGLPPGVADEWDTSGSLANWALFYNVPAAAPPVAPPASGGGAAVAAVPSPPTDLARVRTTSTFDLWAENVSQAHSMRVEVEVLDATWKTVATDVPVVALEWTVDGAALEDLTGSMQVAAVGADGRSWWPGASHDPLTPFGNRLRVTLTCDGVNGPISVLLGHALILTVELQRPDGLINVTFVDIAREYSQSLLESSQPDDGTPVLDAAGQVTDYALNTRQFYFGKMLNECRVPAPRWDGWMASVPFVEMPGTRAQWTAGTSRWEVLQRIADVDNMRLWINRDGRLSFSRSTLESNATAVTAAPVMTLSTGPGGTVHRLRTSLTRDGACNRAVVWTERNEPFSTADVSVGGYGHAEATAAPMVWPGTIGDATYVETWGTASSSQALFNAAADRLKQRRGIVRTMTVDTLPMPFVDPGDVVEVRTQSSVERFVVRSWRVSLPANLMTIEANGWVTGDQATITPLHGSADQVDVAVWPLEQQLDQEVLA